MLFFPWLIGYPSVAPPHIDARKTSLDIFCKLHLDILVQDKPVAVYVLEQKYRIAPFAIFTVQIMTLYIKIKPTLI